MSQKLRAGEFKMKAETKEPVWCDRKRLTVFALPISFTIYTLTESRISIQRGLLNTHEEEIMLFRVRDISYTQSLFERLANTGTVIISSTDATTPVVKLEHVKNAKDVKELLLQLVEQNRKKNRVRTAEVMDDDGNEDGLKEDGLTDENDQES